MEVSFDEFSLVDLFFSGKIFLHVNPFFPEVSLCCQMFLVVGRKECDLFDDFSFHSQPVCVELTLIRRSRATFRFAFQSANDCFLSSCGKNVTETEIFTSNKKAIMSLR